MTSTIARAARPLARLAAVAVLLVAAAGCGDEVLMTQYGALRGESVNGVGVLAKMIEDRGHRVLTARYLSPALFERGDVIVWFPNDFQPPSRDVRLWLEEWLQASPDRVLIYVGRDYDAAAGYWRQAAALAPPALVGEFQRREGLEETWFQQQRWPLQTPPPTDDDPWFTIDATARHRDVRTLYDEDYDIGLAAGVDPTKVEIELNSRIKPGRSAWNLLTSDSDVLVFQTSVGSSSLYVVANGSFLLNLPLVNHEHRKLAAHLIDQIETGDEKRKVVFLQTGYGGPPIHNQEPEAPATTTLGLLARWPLAPIVVQLVALGLLFCVMRWPIFGPVLAPAPAGTGDFGQHIAALGEMLERTKDREYAVARLNSYQLAVEKSSWGSAASARRKRLDR